MKPVKISTTPEAVREAMAIDKFVPVKTILINGRYHKVETRECLYCHVFYETMYVNSRYCSDKHKNAQSRAREKNRRLGIIHCIFCGNKVESVDKRRKFCKTQCREAMRKA